MEKKIKIDDLEYTLFTTKDNVTVESELISSRDYNDGLDFFLGCDCASVYVYLVNKEKVALFIEEVNKFITVCENNNDISDEYMGSSNDFYFVHREIKDSEYDLLFTNFNFNYCGEKSYHLNEQYVKLVSKWESLSSFAIYAGADCSNDYSVFEFALAVLYKKNKKRLKEVYANYMDDIEDLMEDDIFDDFPIVNNTKNQKIMLEFIKLFFDNIPAPTRDSDYHNLMNHQSLKALASEV